MIQPSGNIPRIALIGTAGYATVYVDWLIEAHENEQVQIVAATVLPQERNTKAAQALQSTDARFYQSYESMFAEESGSIELCFIPTGIQWHARMSIAALKAGCHVLVEKPLAGSIADVELVQAAEKKYGRWVAVGFQDMYTNEILELKKSLLSGVIGTINSVSMLGAWPRPKSYYMRNQWAGRLETDGKAVLDSPLNNAFAHFVNLSLFLASDQVDKSIDAQVVHAELFHAHQIESFDTAVVRAKASNGVDLWFGVTHATAETREPRIRIIGDKGSVVWEHEGCCTISPKDEPSKQIEVPKYDETRREMFLRVLKRLTSPTLPICDTEIAKCHTAFIERVHEKATIETVAEDDIEPCFLEGCDTPIPAIRDIVSRLEQAFDQSGDLGDLTQRTAPV